MGFNGQFHSDQWHHDAANITIRDGIKSRRWGVRVTVYDDPTPANNGEWVLSYNLVSTDLQDNANWFKTADIGQVWGGGAPVVYTFTNGVEEAAGVVSLATVPGTIVQQVWLSSHSGTQLFLGCYGNASENVGSDIQVTQPELIMRYITDASNGESVGFNISAGNAFFIDGRATPAGLEYDNDYSAFYTNRTMPDVEYVNTHFGTVALSSLAQSPGAGEDGYALVWDFGSLEYTLAAVPTNTAAQNELPKSDAGGNLVPSSIGSINPGELELGIGTTTGDTRIIRTTGSDPNIGIVIAGKGTAAISFSPGGTIDGMAIASTTGASILYSVNGAAGTDQLLMVRHSVKETGFTFLTSAIQATFQGGHTGTGALSAKATFAVVAKNSESTANGGDDITITAGDGSNTAGHINTPGGNILITAGTGGTDSANDGGDLRFSAGAGGGGGDRGNIFFDNIPTSVVGLASGALYSNAGVLTLAP